MEVAWPGGARQRWVARVGNRASKPLPLDAAKRAAVAMLRERGKGEARDWINQIAANDVDRTVLMQERKQWPLDFMGGARRHSDSMQVDGKMRDEILSAELHAPEQELLEPLQGDDYPLDYDADGDPKLPACVDRRRKPLAEAVFVKALAPKYRTELLPR